MKTLRLGGHGHVAATDVSNFDELCAAIEDDEADADRAFHPLSDDLVPYHRDRVVSYVGGAGNWVNCPHCGIGGQRVDHRGGYACQNCGFSNLQERPTSDGCDIDDGDDPLDQF